MFMLFGLFCKRSSLIAVDCTCAPLPASTGSLGPFLKSAASIGCTVPCLSFAQQLNALARWRGVPSSPSNSLFVSDKMAEVPGAGEPMEVVEEERSAEAGVGSSITEEGAGSAAEPALPPPPPPPPNPAQNPHPQLSITPVRKFSSLLQ